MALTLRNRLCLVGLILLVTFTGACSRTPPTTNGKTISIPVASEQSIRHAKIDARDAEIAEAAFRTMLKPYLKGNLDIFLSVDRHDPRSYFMQRFSGSQVPIKKLSECKTPENRLIEGVRDPVTSRWGVIISINKWHWRSKTLVDVDTEAYMGGNAAEWYRLRIKLLSGKWQVVKTTGMGVA